MNQQNYSRCVDVLNKLVEKDNPKAMLYLSVIYLQGKGGYTNLEEGKRLLILSANKGLPSAQFNLGCCYAKLKGMNFDVFEYSLFNTLEDSPIVYILNDEIKEYPFIFNLTILVTG